MTDFFKDVPNFEVRQGQVKSPTRNFAHFHVKMAVFPNCFYLGSANLTVTAAEANIEAGVRVTCCQRLKEATLHAEDLWSAGTPWPPISHDGQVSAAPQNPTPVNESLMNSDIALSSSPLTPQTLKRVEGRECVRWISVIC